MSFPKLFNFLPRKPLPDPVLPEYGRLDGIEIDRIFARLFSSDDGKKALAYLQSMSFLRLLPADAPETQIRHAEGQRALVGQIMRHIQRGRTVPSRK